MSDHKIKVEPVDYILRRARACDREFGEDMQTVEGAAGVLAALGVVALQLSLFLGVDFATTIAECEKALSDSLPDGDDEGPVKKELLS